MNEFENVVINYGFAVLFLYFPTYKMSHNIYKYNEGKITLSFTLLWINRRLIKSEQQIQRYKDFDSSHVAVRLLFRDKIAQLRY